MRAKQLITSTARTLLLIIACFGMAQSTLAATLVSGAVTTNTSWTLAQSPYQVTADVVIQNGAMLTIEPGVTVGFDSGTNLTIGVGALNARGTAGQPITFTSSLEVAGSTPAAGDWGQIRFLDLTNDTASIIEHAGIRYGHGISIQSASPTFNYLQIDSNLGAAISVDLNSSPKGNGNKASGNTLNGISVPSGDVLGTVTWGIKGIPYVVEAGVVSVGATPTITAISPAEVQQSLSIDAVITGTRLTGADSITFEAAGINAALSAGGSDNALPVHITASATQPLTNVPFSVRTTAGWTRYEKGINVIPLKPTITVNSILPSSLRRGETKNFQINGSSLLGAQVSTQAGGGLTLSGLQTTATQGSFSLSASASAMLGTQSLSISNPAVANGTVALLVTIVDAQPKINTITIPSAVIPDGVARSFLLSLTAADTVDHSFSLSTADPTIIAITPAVVTIPAGSTSVPISIAGLKLGYTQLNITSPTIAAASKQIYASSLLNGAVIDPVLSPNINVNVPFDYASQMNSIISPTISVETPLPGGALTSVTSGSISVEVPFTSNGAVLSPQITVSVP